MRRLCALALATAVSSLARPALAEYEIANPVLRISSGVLHAHGVEPAWQYTLDVDAGARIEFNFDDRVSVWAVGEVGYTYGWPDDHSVTAGAGVLVGDPVIVHGGLLVCFLAGRGALAEDMIYGLRLAARLSFIFGILQVEPAYEWRYLAAEGGQVHGFRIVCAVDLGGILDLLIKAWRL